MSAELHLTVLRTGSEAVIRFSVFSRLTAVAGFGWNCRAQPHADGTTRDFYQIGLSANTTGISVYILGIQDKTYLVNTYGKKLGKASVTGYCIKFKTLKDINMDILEAAIRDGLEAQS